MPSGPLCTAHTAHAAATRRTVCRTRFNARAGRERGWGAGNGATGCTRQDGLLCPQSQGTGSLEVYVQHQQRLWAVAAGDCARALTVQGSAQTGEGDREGSCWAHSRWPAVLLVISAEKVCPCGPRDPPKAPALKDALSPQGAGALVVVLIAPRPLVCAGAVHDLVRADGLLAGRGRLPGAAAALL